MIATIRYSILVHKFYAADKTWWDGHNLLWMRVPRFLHLVLSAIDDLNRVLEVNTGLICSCTPALKPFYEYLASKGFAKSASGGSTAHPKNSVPPERRSDCGPVEWRNTGSGGFAILGDNGTEMEVARTKASDVVQDV